MTIETKQAVMPQAICPELTRKLQKYVTYILSDKGVQNDMRSIRSGKAALFVIEAENSSMVGHVFTGSKMELLLRYHHDKQKPDDLLLITCDNYFGGKPLVQSLLNDNYNDIQNGASPGQTLLQREQESCGRKQRLVLALNELEALKMTKENACYVDGKVDIKKMTPLRSYFPQENLPF